MAAAPDKLAALRHLLAERFPTSPRSAGRVLCTGLPSLDNLAGGLPLGAVTEIVCGAPSCGGHLLLEQLLSVTRQAHQRAALIDSVNNFDPASYPQDLLAHLLWVRCPRPSIALQVADVLSRDANLSLVVLDLRRGAESTFRRTPATFWYRLQRAVESTDLALVIETPRACIPSAQLRLVLNAPHSRSVLEQERPTITAQLTPALQRQRLSAAVAG
jgi:hypothetical protein